MGLQMDNEFASALAPLIPALQNLPKPKVHDVETRRQILAGFTTNAQLPEDVAQTIHNVKTPDGYSLPIWHLKRTDRNPSSAGGPAVLHIHGGGFISLSPAVMMAGLAEYVVKTDIQLFAVDYRLAPEHPYPTPLDDCWAALTWIMSQAEELGVDASRVGLMGQSAGGGLAAGLTLLARDRQLQPPIARQILGYPMLDDRNSESMPEGIITLWNEEDNVTGWTAYLGRKVQSDHVPIYAAPARAKDVKGLPPLYMDIGQLDLFVKENLAYVGKFLDARVETEFHIYPGLSHGFEGLAPNHPVAKETCPNNPTDLKERNVNIATDLTRWERSSDPAKPRRVLINNFSAAGGNSAMLIDDAPILSPSTDIDPRSVHLVAISARSPASLQSNLRSMHGFLKQNEQHVQLGQLSYTTTARRMHHRYRVMLAGANTDELCRQIESALREDAGVTRPKSGLGIIFTFTGQGAQYPGMGKQLFDNFSVFRKEMLQLERIAQALGFPQMLPVIEADEGRDIGEFLPAAVQLASICMQIALCRLWASWGIVPDAVVGHSLGEYAALNAAGVLSDADTLHLVGKRAELLQERCRCDTHAMLVVRASVAQIERVLGGDVTKHKVEFACINSPVETVLAGTKDAITESAAILTGASLQATLLKVPYAFHSAQLGPMLSELEQVAKYVRFSKPTVPVLCPVDGSLVKDVGVFGPQYMVRHSREPVNMLQELSAARNNNVVTDLTAMLEIGPHPAIGAMIRAVLGSHVPTLASCQRGRSTWHVLTASLKHMYTAGADIRWLEYHRDFKSSHKVISLPSYNWDMTDYWIPYVHDWSLRKGDPPLIINSGGGPRLDTTTVHRVVQETACSADQLRVVVEADIQRPDLSPVVQGQEVDGIPLCTASVYAYISLTLGTYLVQRYRPSQAGNLVDVTDMTITKALILRAGQKQQLLQGHAHVDWSTNSAVVVFMSFDNKQKLQEHSRCTLRFKDGPPLQKSLQKGVARVTQRLQALRDGVGHGTTARYNRAMAYRAIRPLARFHPDYRAVDEAILDSVKLECSSHLNFTTLKKGGKFHTHPAVIDALTQSCGFTMNCNDSADLDEEYMNHGWGWLQLFEDIDLQKSYRTYTLMKEGIDNMYHGDVVVLDDHDKVVAFFGQITIQRVPRRVLKVILTMESGAKSQRQVTTSRSEIATMKTPTSDPVKPIIRHSSSAAAVPDPVSAKEDAAARSSSASGGSQTPSGLARAFSIIAEESGLAVTDLTDGTVLADAGIDSLLALTISARFKEELDVDLDLNALFVEYPTVGELKTFVGKVTFSTVSSAETSNPTSGAAEYADTIVSSSASMAGGSLEKHQDGPLAQKVDVNRALQIISEESGVATEDLTNDTVFSDAGVDSLLSLVITSRFRDELGLGIQLESLLLECPTVGELKAYLLGGDSDTTQAATQSSSPSLVAAASLPTTETQVSEIRSDLPPRSQEESNALTARQNAVDRLVHKYTSGFSAPQSVPSSSAPTEEGTVVLVTGATGSLGSHLAYMLAQRADLKRVVCLNRENRDDAYTRQVKKMREKGIRFPETLKPKLLVLQADTSKPMLGLERNTYGNLVDSVTHIIHNAWPMSGKRALDRFEPQFQVMQNLIQLSSDIASRRPSSFKVSFQMVSSIGVVGLYGLQDSKEHKDKTKPTVVPEARLGIDSVLPNGYGEVKWGCERMLDETLRKHPDRCRTMVVRLGQIAGSKSHGYWSPMEHISFLVKSSQTVKALPNLGGTVRWTPVEDVAGTLIDLVLSDQKRDPHPFYHIDHPVGQPWAQVNAILADKNLI